MSESTRKSEEKKPAPLQHKRDNQQLAFVPIEKIWWEPRSREDLGDIVNLAESIREKGILQPITVTPEFELLAGERRTTAARSIGLAFIPALIRRKEDILDALEIEAMENLFRKDFTWNEECAHVRKLDLMYKEKHTDWSGRKTAALLNKGVASVARALQLAKAMEIMPELGEYKTADDALKVLKKFETDAIIDELRSRQVAKQAFLSENEAGATAVDKGISLALKYAEKHYHIADALQELVEMESNRVIHLIECDPPYGIALAEQKQAKDTPGNIVDSYQEIPAEKYKHFLKVLATELYRVAGQDCWLVFWFGPTWQREVLDSLREAKWEVDEIPAIWIKPSGQTNQPEMYLARAYEPFFLARKGKPYMTKRGRRNVFDFSPVPGQKKIHPTERPVELLEELLNTLTVVGQRVLVPFLGSGNTLRAAYNLGMIGWGYDLNPEYKSSFMLRIEEDARKLLTNEDNEDELPAHPGDADDPDEYSDA